MHTLSQDGIASISLATVSTDLTIGDAKVTEIATVTFADGHTTQIGDAWFDVTDSSEIGKGVRMDGTSGNDVLYGTDNNDVLAGHGGNDVLFGGKGADTFVMDSTKGVAEIRDFNAAEGDKLDLSALLHNVDPVTAAINNFVFTTQVGNNTVVSIDQSGSGNAAHAVQVAVLDNVHLSTDDLLHHAVVQAAAAA